MNKQKMRHDLLALKILKQLETVRSLVQRHDGEEKPDYEGRMVLYLLDLPEEYFMPIEIEPKMNAELIHIIGNHNKSLINLNKMRDCQREAKNSLWYALREMKRYHAHYQAKHAPSNSECSEECAGGDGFTMADAKKYMTDLTDYMIKYLEEKIKSEETETA